MRSTGTGCLAAALAAAVAATPAAADPPPVGTVELSKAWVSATAETRRDVPLYMAVTNRGEAPDSLVRVRCPADLADFTEKHATDRGEGGTAMREVKNFTVPAGETMTLAPGGNHLMLLHLRKPLQEGQTFTCSVVFQKAGAVPVEVKVVPGGATQAPKGA